MRYPDIQELPLPPVGKKGWPWEFESARIADSFLCGRPTPRISIVTPSLNQGEFIEETIRSVLLQGYPDIEYIIIDGGSTDGTMPIIEKYSPWLHYWISEPDKGQSHAINKGFNRATGSIYAYINSDDLYEPNVFGLIAAAFSEHPSPDLVAGICTVFDQYREQRSFHPCWPDTLSEYVRTTFSSTFGQPASFWTADIHRKAGGFDESMSFCFDREFFLRIGLADAKPKMISSKIARFREHTLSKSVTQALRFHQESIKILDRYGEICGVSVRERKTYAQTMRNEIAYLETFSIWKDQGRKRALLSFLQMILNSPNLLLQRKILGQMRRLLFFRTQNVAELH